ncbi:MAG: hypothetical protein ABSH33_06830 [Steroidobacteraceae bacterium]|jgi:hypothetical protein
MTSSMESAAAFNSRLVFSRGAPCRAAPRSLGAHLVRVLAHLRGLAPFAMIALPGGALMALLWWLYRRRASRLLGRGSKLNLDGVHR